MNSTRTSGEQDSAIDVDLVVGDLHVGLELRLRKHSMRLSDFQVLHDIGVCAVLISRQDLLKVTASTCFPSGVLVRCVTMGRSGTRDTRGLSFFRSFAFFPPFFVDVSSAGLEALTSSSTAVFCRFAGGPSSSSWGVCGVLTSVEASMTRLGVSAALLLSIAFETFSTSGWCQAAMSFPPGRLNE